ncbi:MAG TPA: histidine kinase, partial [Bacilli bacterium]
KLLLLKNSSLYVNEVKVYIPLINRTISTNNYEVDMPEAEVNALRNLPNFTNSPFISFNNQLLLSEVYPNPIYKSKNLAFALEVELSKPQIELSLQQIMKNQGGGAVLFNLEQNWEIGNEADPLFFSNIKLFLNEMVKKGKYTGQGRVDISNKTYLVTFEQSPTLETTLLVYVPEAQILRPVNKYRIWFWLLSGFSICIVIFFSYWIYRLIHRPLNRLVRVFRKVEKGELQISIHHKQEDEFHYLYEQFNVMVQRLQLLIHEVYEQKIRLQNSELRQLQSQINPHFLYNSFFVLFHMAQSHDIENVIRMTKHLGDYFQFITRNASDDVKLEREIDHAKSYVEIQTFRFSKRITVEWEEQLDSDLNLVIPRLILQPIIENAYKHGLEDKVSEGILKVRIESQADYLYIVVEDNGNYLTDEKLAELQHLLVSAEQSIETTGIINVNRRLQLKFGKKYGLHVCRSKLGGLQVEIKIPYEKIQLT